MQAGRLQSRWSRPWFVGIPIVAGLVAGAPARSAAGPQSVLPPGNAVSGWKQIGAVKTYDPTTLYDHVDGEAEATRQYTFKSDAYAEYAPSNSNKPAITVDVYDMSNPLNAFGLFSNDRIGGHPTNIGTEGVTLPPTGLNFWKGRYVVRTAIVAQRPGPVEHAAQITYARAIAARIVGTSQVPPQVRALPPGMKPRSDKYQLNNVVGMAFVRNAVVADYPSYGLGAQLFIAEYPTAAGAKSALSSYQAHERTSGTGLAPLAGVGEAGFRVVDRFQKNVVVAQKGRHLVGIVRARDPNAATSLVRQAIANVG